jgi:hypothetical protein
MKIVIYPSFFQALRFSGWTLNSNSVRFEKGKGDFCGNGNGKTVSNRHEVVSRYDTVSEAGRTQFCNRSA